MSAQAPETSPPQPVDEAPPPGAADALAAVTQEMEALLPAQVLVVNADVPVVATRALAVAGRVRAFEAAVRERLPFEPIDPIAKLGTYALAAWYSHAIHWKATDRAAVKVMVKTARASRSELLLCAQLLARIRLVNPEHVAAIRRGHGHTDLAADLVALAALFDSIWPSIAGRVPLQPADIRRAAALGAELIASTADTIEAKALRKMTADRRARSYTLLIRAYDSCRRLLTFLRWEERDVDQIAPSLFHHARSKRATKKNGTPGVETPAPELEASNPVAPA